MRKDRTSEIPTFKKRHLGVEHEYDQGYKTAWYQDHKSFNKMEGDLGQTEDFFMCSFLACGIYWYEIDGQ